MEVERLSDSRPWHAHYDYWVRPHLNYPRRPLTDILRIAAADVPDRPATAFFGQQLTFAEVKERADKFATALSRMGVKQGDRVGVMLPNCPHYIIFSNVVQSTSLHIPSLRRGEERYLLVIPFFHIYGFTVGLMAGTWLGAQQILIPKYDVDALLNAVRDYRPTYFPAVPTIFISLLNHPKSREYGLDKIRAFNSGSAPLPLEVLEQFEQLTGGMLSEGYGLSEASPVTHNSPSLSVRKPGSVGIPLPDTDQKVVDLGEGTREVPNGEEGELCIAGPQVMKGYWNRPDETATTIRTDANGTSWLYTG